jgi:DNA polymerase I-like protein with 3'-5' exonuclease and polymerase domains
MQGFFNLDTLPTASMDGKSDLSPKIHDCKRCGLFSECNTPKFPTTGNGKKRILIIGPAVGRIEDESKGERKSSSYKYLASNLKKVGIDMEEDCWYSHAIRCHTKGNIGLTTQSGCHRMLMKEIDELDPVVIVPADPEAWTVLLYDRLTGRASFNGYSDWCGELIPDQVLLRWVAPIYSASFVDGHNDKQYNPYLLFWRKQMENMLIPTRKPKKIDTNTHVCKTIVDAINAIKVAMGWSSFAFDYETTGIKPYDEGHKIAYISISDGEIAYSFPNFNDSAFQTALRLLMLNDAVKIAHNANFERSWTKEILGYEVNNLTQDTMIIQHCLNNRKPTGLKFLTYARYGYLGYDSDADEYLRASTEDERTHGTNAINRIFDAPTAKIMEYNALDSLFTAWLFNDLYRELDRVHQLPGYKFFMELSIALYHAHREGFLMDMDLLGRTEGEIEKAIRPYIDKIMNDPLIVKEWSSAHPFNPRSDYDIRALLFDILKLEPREFTDKGQPSVDAESLALYQNKVPIISSIFQIKRLGKLGGTYIRQMKAEQNNGVMRSFYNLNGVVTYRSSSSATNMQNCFTPDMEILTKAGWRRFDEVQVTDEVAQFSTEDKTISFTYPDRLVKEPYNGDIIHIHTDTYIDMYVTPDHECLIQSIVNGKWLKMTADKYPPQQYQPISGIKCGGTREYSDNWIRFIVALQADGHVTDYGIELAFKKQRKIDRMKSILDECSLSYSIYHKKSGNTTYYVPYSKNEILLQMRKWKYFNYSILNWDHASLLTFLLEIGEWDGCRYHGNHIMYCSSIELNVDVVQAVCALTECLCKKRMYKNKSGIYPVLDITLERTRILTSNHTKDRIPHNGYVYCVTVPDGNIVIRHNGRMLITGNCPKRDKESRKIIRSMYKPRRGHKLVEYDFKSMEVSVAAAVTGDKNLIKYVTDPSTDMHRDLARGLFMVDDVSKNLRGIATKGPWTFAQFYGSWYKQCAAGVWVEIDIPNAVDVYGFDVVKHLRKCGIRDYEQWENHCAEQEYILWNEFFPDYKKWRDETFDFFKENGYVDYTNGFRYYGPATRNEVLNGPVQGPAFGIQAWAFKEMDKYMRANDYETKLIGQIHDSIIADVLPAEEGMVDKMIHKFATEEVRDHWDWITVPLVMEKDCTEVDQSWAEMESMGVLRG